jgi:hypothetical protein
MSSVVISIHECYKLSHVDNTFNEYKSNDLDKKKGKSGLSLLYAGKT